MIAAHVSFEILELFFAAGISIADFLDAGEFRVILLAFLLILVVWGGCVEGNITIYDNMFLYSRLGMLYCSYFYELTIISLQKFVLKYYKKICKITQIGEVNHIQNNSCANEWVWGDCVDITFCAIYKICRFG